MTLAFLGSSRLSRFRRGAVLVAAFAALLVGGTAPATAAPTPSEDTAASVVRVDASQWNVNGKKVTRLAAGAFPSGNVYCTPTYGKPKCLQPLVGQVNYLGCGAESGGGDVDIVVRNQNATKAPRDISVFVREGDTFRMFFGDRDWAKRGKNVTEYRGISDGTYFIGVGWDDQVLTFYGNAFTVACGGGNG